MNNVLRYCTVVLIILANLSMCYSDKDDKEKCPLKKTSLVLDIQRLSGIWYRTAGYPFYIAPNENCEFLEVIENSSYSFFFNAVQYNKTTHKGSNIRGYAYRNDSINPHVLNTVIYQPRELNMENFRILKVDYANYALFNACVYVGTKYAGHIFWILTRIRNPTGAIWEHAFEACHEFGIDTALLVKYNQDMCFELQASDSSSEPY